MSATFNLRSSSSSSNSSEQFHLIPLKLRTLYDWNIKRSMLENHKKYHSLTHSPQQLLVSICDVLMPAINFIDSVVLNNEVSKKRNGLDSSILAKFNSKLPELSAMIGHRGFSARTLWESRVPRENIDNRFLIPMEFSTISELRTLAEYDYFRRPISLMEKTADNAVQMFDKIDVHQASLDLAKDLYDLSWDAKAVNTMGCFTFKFLEFLGFLLHGSGQPITKLASSMATLIENPISLAGSPLEKFQIQINYLNNLIKLTLKAIEYISELTLLSDTEYSKDHLLSMSVYWATVSILACDIQITLLMYNGEVALELSPLITNLSDTLNDLKFHCRILKPKIGEKQAHLQHIATFQDVFLRRTQLSSTSIDISMLMKNFMYSNDGCSSFIDGSKRSKVGLEVLKEKAIIFFISDLDVESWLLTHFLQVYEEIKKENYYKIVWVPFVLKWTEELRHKFEILKLKMPWYIVHYNSAIAGVWFFKGRYFFPGRKNSIFILDLQQGNQNPDPFADLNVLLVAKAGRFPGKLVLNVNLVLRGGYQYPNPADSADMHRFVRSHSYSRRAARAALPSLRKLYYHADDLKQKKPSSGFQGLLQMRQTK